MGTSSTIPLAIIQVIIMMVLSAVMLLLWVYFLIEYEGINNLQLSGYYLIFAICGLNIVFLGPFTLCVLMREKKREHRCYTRIILTSYSALCLLSVLPTILLCDLLGKEEWTKNYIREFFIKYGRVPYLLEYMQKAQHCCGHTSYKDFFKNPEGTYLEESVPRSCCSENVIGCQNSENRIYKEGCFVYPRLTSTGNSGVSAWAHPFHGTGFLPVALVPLAVPLFYILQTCYLHEALTQKGADPEEIRDKIEIEEILEEDMDGDGDARTVSSGGSRRTKTSGTAKSHTRKRYLIPFPFPKLFGHSKKHPHLPQHNKSATSMFSPTDSHDIGASEKNSGGSKPDAGEGPTSHRKKMDTATALLINQSMFEGRAGTIFPFLKHKELHHQKVEVGKTGTPDPAAIGANQGQNKKEEIANSNQKKLAIVDHHQIYHNPPNDTVGEQDEDNREQSMWEWEQNRPDTTAIYHQHRHHHHHRHKGHHGHREHQHHHPHHHHYHQQNQQNQQNNEVE